MRFRQFAIGTILTVAVIPLSWGAADAVVTPQIEANPAVPFSLTGKISKIVTKQNQVTVIQNNRRYVVITNSTTSITVKSKHVTIRKLVVGQRVRVTGRLLGPLMLALTIAA